LSYSGIQKRRNLQIVVDTVKPILGQCEVLARFCLRAKRNSRLHDSGNVTARPSQPLAWEICILAGGLSRRMGRDKARLKLGPRTMLARIRSQAKSVGWPVRVIRRDAVPRCGPLGGVLTALRSTRADAVLFLACDMPWIDTALLRAMQHRLGRTQRAVFVGLQNRVGFPFALRSDARSIVAEQIERKEFTLQALARALAAKTFHLSAHRRSQLRNVNTPSEWERTRRLWARSRGAAGRKIL
jgi:molybdenum cofactor guanylyltransferase